MNIENPAVPLVRDVCPGGEVTYPPGPSGFPEWQSADGNHRIILGDCLQVLKTLDTSEVVAVLADPPYGIGYQHSGGKRANWRGRRGRYEANRKFDKIHGDNTPFDPSPFMYWPCLLWGADHFASVLPEGSWLCWDKSVGIGPDDSFADAEFAWCSEKGIKRNVFRYLWKGLCCVKAGEANGRRIHATQKPLQLMTWCLSFLPPGLILDPFAGSCTVAVACARTGRRSISIEIEEKYFRSGIQRMEREAARMPLFEPRQTQKELTL